MTNNIFLQVPAACSQCGFTTTDVHLLAGHSCATFENGGRCEDYPCCGHENGDCMGLLYGSDQAIQADPHLLCDHNTGYCQVEDEEQGEDEDEEEVDDDTWGYNRDLEAELMDRPLFPNEY